MQKTYLRKKKNPIWWISSLYFAEGLPNVIISFVAIVMYKRLAMEGACDGLDNATIAFWVSLLYLPWMIKPFWSPIVDVLKTKRWWILTMQFFLGAAFAGVAFALPLDSALQWTLVFFWLAAFSSATHDIAADGYYMQQLDSHHQALFVGIRSTFYRISGIAGQALLLMLASNLEVFLRDPVEAWSLTFVLASVVFFALWVYHSFCLPVSDCDHNSCERFSVREAMLKTVAMHITFFFKPGFWAALAFMLLYRFPEALLTKVCPLFMLDRQEVGGLALSTSQLAYIQGVIGTPGMLLGGILGGIVVARDGFKKWFWPMVAAISVPNVIYVLLAYWQPSSTCLVGLGVFIEQFGYGFGFTAYMLYMLYFSQIKFVRCHGAWGRVVNWLFDKCPALYKQTQGEHQTSHYAFCTGLMALGLMGPGIFSGWFQEQLGYLNFFIIIIPLCLLTVLVSRLIKVPGNFGRK